MNAATTSIATAVNLDVAYSQGFAAYDKGEMRAPALNAVVMDLVGVAAVGAGAAELFAAFTRGFDAAADLAIAALLAEDA